jgi:hypothetical protein
MSTVCSDVIFSIPITSFVPFPLLHQNCPPTTFGADIRMEEKFTSRMLCVQRKHLAVVCISEKELFRKSNNVVSFSISFPHGSTAAV